jgi:hypothetical protein
MSVLGPAGAGSFLAGQEGRLAFPEGFAALVFGRGPEGSLATFSFFLGTDGKLHSSRILTPAPEKPAARDSREGIPILPRAALSFSS